MRCAQQPTRPFMMDPGRASSHTAIMRQNACSGQDRWGGRARGEGGRVGLLAAMLLLLLQAACKGCDEATV